MKRTLFFLFITLLFLAYHQQTLADSVVTEGNASSTVHVSTDIEGSGSVTTHIQSTVNGNTKTLDSNSPGSYTLENSSDDSSNSPTALESPTPTLSHPSIATPTSQIRHAGKVHSLISFIAQMRALFHVAIQHVLAFFSL